MGRKYWTVAILALCITISSIIIVSATLNDEVKDIMASVNTENCHQKSADELTLDVHMSEDQEVFITAKTLALSQAFVYSITNQMLNRSFDFQKQPDLFYFYLSTTAALLSNDAFVGSGVYYDHNTSYPNWYHSLYLNQTLPLFAPFASRDLDIVKVKDDGVRNYTLADTVQSWFGTWLPDKSGQMDLVTKDVFSVSDETSFIALANQRNHDVRFTRPYFDCGRTNKWIVTVAAPVVDYLPRYCGWAYLRRPRFVAVSTVDVDFNAIDHETRSTSTLEDVMQSRSSVVERLSQLFSSSLQVSHVAEEYDDLSSSKTINPSLVFAEVAAAVFADEHIAACEAVLEHTAPNMDGPISVYVQKGTRVLDSDYIGLDSNHLLSSRDYFTQEQLSARKREAWTGGIETEERTLDVSARMGARSSSLTEIENWVYRVPAAGVGLWSQPTFSTQYQQMLVNYTTPVLGPNAEFRGEVTCSFILPDDMGSK